ncbi:uncharacterized protein CcaverHIS019_0504650 [Cutaneotrichosporon cavernicola]|uniref:Peptidase M48 domain-containing protein n=1 Tax=Cutaneotrichosporon cavernicola TaxID=279322 RepID=A0AA48QX31_9TREE|nr:uncharacterized protein CcaverHIS019_0504650 [Cutaneotrichosporon cavernicola]BEI92837.1 hypothetical protein CcaverHIS019_0504650 [Cutaneotrichosporon cavernicola]BEJ00613.1 hypothetical protein CcaverHIS631_0504700 [Cutaneotrichosporon cavernicola]BEJ08380.1 hypothetical protein CcaverHIS641_0504650 [Cutaneotrichosporon cavernicola]
MFRPLFAAARATVRSVPRAAAPSQRSGLQALRRPISSTSRRSVEYRRFDTRSSGQPNSSDNAVNYVRRRVGGDRGMVIYGVLIGGGVIYYVAHLERVPVTGRLRFMDCSPEQESEIGQATYSETMAQLQGQLLPPNHPVTRRVREIAKRIVERNGLGRVKEGHTLSTIEEVMGSWGMGGGMESPGNISATEEGNENAEWEVYVVDDSKTMNAFVIPGGKIFVFTGILPVSGNDSGLATVMGHEISHVVARHGAERMSYMKVLFAVSFILETLGLDVGLTRALVTLMLQLPNSRTSESEADDIGLRLMAKACYDPSEAPKVWERMSEMGGGGGKFDITSTHPANRKRIKALEKELPLANELAAANCSGVADHKASFDEATANWSKWS